MSTLNQACSPLELTSRRSTIGGLVFEAVSEIDDFLCSSRPGDEDFIDQIAVARNHRFDQ